MNNNFYALVESRMPRDLSAPCLETAEELVYSWRDLQFGSARLAGWLASLNLGKDEQGFAPRIAVQVDKSPEALMLYLAALRAGWVFVPLNTAYQRSEIDYFVRDVQPSVFICTPQRFNELEPLALAAGVSNVLTLSDQRGGTLLEAATPFSDQFAYVPRKPNDLAVILYTSGTTGRSKGAMLTHGNLSSNALVLDDFWGFREERDTGERDVLLHALPLFHIHGLLVATHAALVAGAQMIFLPKFDAQQVLKQLPRCTVFMGVPTYYTRLLAEPALDRQVCRNMRLFVSGSAPLLKETFEDFRARSGHTIVERYGMSETMMLTSNPYFGTARDRIGGTVGQPLPGVTVRVVGDDGFSVPPGQVGHVQVRGPNVCAGYWRLPEKTKEEFTPDGYFKTGDMGHFGASNPNEPRPNNYLTLVGRSKDLIISGGYNVYPKEVESRLDEMPGVLESAVFGLPHPDFGEAVVAVVVAKDAFDEDTLIAQLKEQIANYKVPKRIWVVDALPRNAMGKVQKNLLRDQYRETFALVAAG